MTRLRIAFMGTPDFAVPSLAALIEAGHDVACVYSQPPRPSGRGHKVQPSPVHALAERNRLPVRTPTSLRSPEEQAAFAALNPDVAVVAAYGLILPRAILDAPRLGCINVHASLLPRWRGAAPIQRAILAGDTETGVTIMQMEAGLDTGPMLVRESVPITKDTTAAGLHVALADLGAGLVVRAVADLAAGRLIPVPQPEEGVTYAAKIDRTEGRLDWTLPAEDLDRRIRALNPWPGTWFERDGQRVRVLAAEPATVAGSGPPGTVLPNGLIIACGNGTALRIAKVQPAGGRPMTPPEFLNGHPLPAGTVLS